MRGDNTLDSAIPRYDNLLDLIEEAFTSYSDLPAFTCLGHTLSYREVDQLSQRFASYLRHQVGLQPGDRVALQMPNILQYPVAMYGILRAGLVVVNTNPLYTARELRHQLKDSGAKALVVLSNVANVASDVIAEEVMGTQVQTVIVTHLADLHPSPKRQLINFVVKHLKKMVPKHRFPRLTTFRHVITTPAQAFDTPAVDSNTLAALQYTGGTTGISKGAMLSHGNLAVNVWQIISHLPSAFKRRDEVFIACLPFYHIYAFNLHGFCALAYGEHNVLIPNPRDLKALVKALKQVQMTAFVGINTLYVALCRFPEFKTVDFSKLHISAAGGMAMTEDASKMWRDITGCEVSEGYGLTETSPVVCANRLDNIHIGTIGSPVKETEIKLIDEEGTTVADGEVGELCVRGPQVMQGYWQRADETAKVMTADGFLKTGDMAVLREDGNYKLVDRKKDMILVSGFNVYPNEVEDLISQHPGVVEAAAIGIADQRSGEVVKLFVVPANAEVTQEELKAFCRENLTAYKCPKVVEFKESLPKSNVGKILRRELRE